MQNINVALIGQGFMGRTHSNAWGQVAKFFKPPLKPVMHTVFGQPEENPKASPKLGLAECRHRLASRGPLAGNRPGRRGHAQLHARPGGQGGDRRRQAGAPAKSPSPARWPTPGRWPRPPRRPGVKTFVWFNYRRCPAVALAHQLVKAGQGGRQSATCGPCICRTGPTTAVPLVVAIRQEAGRLRRPRRPRTPTSST